MGIAVYVTKDRQLRNSTALDTPAPGALAGELTLWVGANASANLNYLEVAEAARKIANELRRVGTPKSGVGVTQGGVTFAAERDHLSNVEVTVDAPFTATEDTVDIAYEGDFLDRDGQSISSAVEVALRRYRDRWAKKAA